MATKYIIHLLRYPGQMLFYSQLFSWNRILGLPFDLFLDL